jgi:ABC-type multidrug transport system ATPase subunit
MKLTTLKLRDVGPFAEADLELATTESSGVTLLTGLNGSGKTVILDAIRYWFGGQYGAVERALPRTGHESGFCIQPAVTLGEVTFEDAVKSVHHYRDTFTDAVAHPLWQLPHQVELAQQTPPFVVDYWCPASAADSYEIHALERPAHGRVLVNALQGDLSRARTTQFLCHAEFLRDSRDAAERALGEALFAAVTRVVEVSLLHGRYLGVRRADYMPMVEQAGHVVPLTNVSGGNTYLIARMAGLLARLYSVLALNRAPVESLLQTPGLLLIDEVETHLHPRWQKRILPMLRELFPNVQVVATTHSPLVLSSVPDARVYTSRYVEGDRVCVVEEGGSYGGKAVQEILASDAFEETAPWSEEVMALLREHGEAIRLRDERRRLELEDRLLEVNPTYFAFLRVGRGRP